ncbi:MAG: DUF397 domain-containing protein [Candidatus Nanopelagicales bacterium]
MEIAFTSDGRVRVYRRGDPGVVLEFTVAEWLAFLAGVREGEFDPFPYLHG